MKADDKFQKIFTDIENKMFFLKIVEILKAASKTEQNTTDITTVITNYKIGQKIVKEEV